MGKDKLTRSRVAKPQAACLLASFASIDVDLTISAARLLEVAGLLLSTVPLAWFSNTGWSQRGFLSLRDPAPSEPGYPFRQ